MLKLHTFFRSSAAYRVRIALNLKGLAYESCAVHFGSGEHRGPAFRAVNPQGLLPVLEHDGVIVTQSLAIIEYLDAQFPEPELIPLDPLERARVQAFAQVIACDTHPLNNLRVLKYLRDELKADETQVKAWYQHWIAESFAACEALIVANGPARFCCGDKISLADVCLLPQVYNARRFDCDLAPYPELSRIADALSTDESFIRAAPEAQADAV